MGKKQPRQSESKKDADEPRGSDPLGKLINRYHVTLGGVLISVGGALIVALAALGYGLTRQPISLGFSIFGAFALLFSIVLLAINAPNLGRRLELRKRGLRYRALGSETEMLWNEVVDIDVERTDQTNIGPVGVQRTHSEAMRPTGPLTKSEWTITIRADDGRSIRLSPGFLRLVGDPKKLVSKLRLAAGMD